MAVAVQSVTTLTLSSRSNTTFTAPSGITNGDLLVILMSLGRNPVTTATAPSGFSSITNFPVSMTSLGGDAYVVRAHAWMKVASGESGSYATSHSTGDTEGIMLRISGQAASPINPAPQITDHAPGTGGASVTAPTITPAVNDSLVIWLGTTWDGFGAASPPSGTTPTYTERANDTSGIFYCATGVLATAGATGTKVVTTGQADGRPWLAAHIVIEADAGGGAAGHPAMKRAGGVPYMVSLSQSGARIW